MKEKLKKKKRKGKKKAGGDSSLSPLFEPIFGSDLRRDNWLPGFWFCLAFTLAAECAH